MRIPELDYPEIVSMRKEQVANFRMLLQSLFPGVLVILVFERSFIFGGLNLVPGKINSARQLLANILH